MATATIAVVVGAMIPSRIGSPERCMGANGNGSNGNGTGPFGAPTYDPPAHGGSDDSGTNGQT